MNSLHPQDLGHKLKGLDWIIGPKCIFFFYLLLTVEVVGYSVCEIQVAERGDG